MPERHQSAKNQVNSFVSASVNVLTILSFIMTVIPAVTAFITKNIIVIGVAIVLFFLACALFFERKRIARKILSLFLNLTAPRKNYKLTEKEVVYEFLDRKRMRLEKIFSVKVLHSSFTGISDKYKWTGDAPLTVAAKDPQHFKITPMEAKFGLERYNIEIKGERRYSAGAPLEMASVIEDIHDPAEKASLHLSVGVYERTDRLVLKVLFNPTLQPTRARRLEYIHYHDDDHYTSDDIEPELDGDKKCLKWEIDKPLYGGKYMIEWEWDS